METQIILGVDPGRSKCGLTVLGGDGNVLARRIVPAEELGAEAARLVAEFSVDAIALGDRTGFRQASEAISQHCPDVPIRLVDEQMTSVLARHLYWIEHPPRGLWLLVPTAWRVPPGPIDDYAALVLAERLRRDSQ